MSIFDFNGSLFDFMKIIFLFTPMLILVIKKFYLKPKGLLSDKQIYVIDSCCGGMVCFFVYYVLFFVAPQSA